MLSTLLKERVNNIWRATGCGTAYRRMNRASPTFGMQGIRFGVARRWNWSFYTTPSIGRRVWKSLRIAKPAAAAARCLSVCPLTIEPTE